MAMRTHSIIARCSRSVVAACLALGLPLSGLAFDNVPPEALNVKVFPDRYVAADRPFSDLAALEAWAKPIRIRTLWLDSCGGPASDTRLLAAVERFHAIYAEGVQIRTLAAEDPGCLGAERAIRGGEFLRDSDYSAVDRDGRSWMP